LGLKLKILKFFDADPAFGMEKSGIRDKNPGSTKMDSSIRTASR
jgi:hypothetical protein